MYVLVYYLLNFIDFMKRFGTFTWIIFVMAMFLTPNISSAQTYKQVISTEGGTLKLGVSTEPTSPKSTDTTKLKIDFLNPKTNSIQEHVDYTVSVTNNGVAVFGPIPLTHTAIGSVTIPIQFKDGNNKVIIDFQGILFQPIPSEKASFSINLGNTQTSPQKLTKTENNPVVKPNNDSNISKKTGVDKKTIDSVNNHQVKKSSIIEKKVQGKPPKDTPVDYTTENSQKRTIIAPKLQKTKTN